VGFLQDSLDLCQTPIDEQFDPDNKTAIIRSEEHNRFGNIVTPRPTLAGFGATPQPPRLALSGASIRRKRHERVMNSAINIIMGRGPKR